MTAPVAKSASAAGAYPAFGLAADLRTIASLIRAELGIRIFYAELGGGGIGGFDNHANQIGNHCALLEQLSESVAAFAADLSRDRLLNRVLLMTFSEFGRRVKENGSAGTDHGTAAPIFVMGNPVRGGIYGEQPSLAATDLDPAGIPPGNADQKGVRAGPACQSRRFRIEEKQSARPAPGKPGIACPVGNGLE